MGKKFTRFTVVLLLLAMHAVAALADTPFQIADPGFENWSESFHGQPALGGGSIGNNNGKGLWYGSNVYKDVGIKVYGQVVHQTTDRHSGKYAAKLEDTEVGVDLGFFSITEVSPAWVTLGTPWSYLSGTDTGSATAGTDGGIQFTHRPDAMAVWIKRGKPGEPKNAKGDDKEKFHLVFYSWTGTSQSNSYLSKGNGCVNVDKVHYDEESDIRTQTDKNTCGTSGNAKQVAEGHYFSDQEFPNWTCIEVPITYYNESIPEKMNIILSASTYPAGRATKPLYKGNYLIVDEVKLIYKSTIDELLLDGEPVADFLPDQHTYTIELGENITFDNIPAITCKRSGRMLSGSEISINYATNFDEPTTITVKAEDGSSTTVYTVYFTRKKSTNSRLNNIFVEGIPVPNFSGYITEYTVDVPYGLDHEPVITVDKGQEDQTYQVVSCGNYPCTAKVTVTAANPKHATVYTLHLKEGQLTDNTLQDILINGKSIPGFKPDNNTYTVELPLGTTQDPTIEAVSKYAAGAQDIQITNNGLNGRSTIVVTPPAGNPRTYRISYLITESTYSYLKDVQVGGVSLADFDPEKTQYNVVLPVGTTQLPAITWQQGDPYQKAALTNEGVEGTSRITVTAQKGNVTIYRIAFSVEKSTVSTLDTIFVDGVALPNFDPQVTHYVYNVNPAATTRPVVTWQAADAYQRVVKTPTSEATATIEGTTKLTVRAQNGNTTVYNIEFTQTLSDNAQLAHLEVEGYTLSPAFSPEVEDYTCVLKRGTTVVPAITFVKGDETQGVRMDDLDVNGTAKITVKAQTGTTKVYRIHFSVQTSSDATLKDIKVGGISLIDFNPNTLVYNVLLPSGTIQLPVIEPVKNDAAQRIAMVKGGVNGTTQILVVAEDGSELTYELHFSVEKSINANLKNIYVGGVALPNFDPNVMMYRYVLAENVSQCPIVKAEGYPGQTIITTQPKLEGTARIEVTPEDGDKNIYTIEFVRSMSNNCLLKNMMVNGQDFGFDPAQNTYALTLPEGTTTVPTVTYSKGDDTQTVQVISGGLNRTTQVVVIAQDGTRNTYQIAFTVEKSQNAQLIGIYVGDVLLPNFDPNTLQYTYTLPNGTTTLPKVTYQAAEEQHVTMLLPQLEGQAIFVVTSPDASQTVTYTIHFEVEKQSDATLQNIFVDGVVLENYQAAIFAYTINRAKGQAAPAVTYQKQHATQQVVVNNQGLQGCTLTVTAQNGNQQVYTLTYNEVDTQNSLLNDIQWYNTALQRFVSVENFSANLFDYHIVLPWNSHVLPVIKPVPATSGQVITLQEGGVQGTTTITVLADDGVTTSTYTLHVEVEQSSDATLSNILLDDNDIPHFDPNVFTYNVSLPYGTTQMPKILFENAYKNGKPITQQQVTVTDGGLNGTSTLHVTSQDGTASNTYTIHFEVATSGKANILKRIEFADGEYPIEILEGKYNYSHNLKYGTTQLPPLKITKNYPEQDIRIAQMGSTYQITVVANQPGVADAVYTISCVYETSPTVLTRMDVKNGAVLYPAYNPAITEYVAHTNSLENIVPVYNPDINKISTQESTPNKLVVKVISLDNSKQTTTYTIHLYKKYPSTTLVGNSGFSFKSGTRDFAFEAPVQKISYQATEVLWSIAKLHLRQWVNSWEELRGDDVSWTTYDNYSSAINPKANKIRYDISGPITTDITVKNVELTYAPTHLHGIKVNGVEAKKSGNTFSATIDTEYTGTPIVEVIGQLRNNNYGTYWAQQLPGQAYNISWEGESNGIRRASFSFYDCYTSHQKFDLIVYRKLSSNSVLKSVTVDGVALSNLKAYPQTNVIKVPAGSSNMPQVVAVTQSAYAKTSFSTIYTPGINGDVNQHVVITVTSEDGSGSHVYYLAFEKEYSADATLKELSVEGYDIDFLPQTQSYTVHLPAGTTQWPAVTYQKQNDAQQVALTMGQQTTLLVTAQNGRAQQTYTIRFVVEPTQSSAQLSLLSLDNGGVLEPTFNKDVYAYSCAAAPTHYLPVMYQRACATDHLTMVMKNGLTQVTVSNEQTANTYQVASAAPVSANALLKTILVNGKPMANFSEQEFNYEVVMQAGLSCDIEPVLAQTDQSMSINFNHEAQTYTIQVVAADGVTTQTYTVTLVAPINNNANLSAIIINGMPLEHFNPETTHYSYVISCVIPKWEEPLMPHIQAVGASSNQSISIENNGINGNTYINVTAQSGITKTYQIAFETQKSDYVYLKNIFKNCQAITEFYPTLNQYRFDVPVTVQRPVISVEAGDAFQTITQSDESNQHTIEVKAQSGKICTYTIYFDQTYTKNALLSGITLDGQLLDGFMPTTYQYDVELPVGTTVLPKIGVISGADGQTTHITTNGVNGDAIITVTADDNETIATYTIHFTVDKSQVNTLLDIQLDGQSMPNFSADVHTYTYQLPIGTRTWPLVTWTPGDAYQSVKMSETLVDTWNKVVTLHVKPQDETVASTTYTIYLEVEKSSVATLKDIQIDYQSYPHFDPQTYQYPITLPIGTKAYPVVSYVQGDAYQQVTPIVQDNMVQLVVVAEDGVTTATYQLTFTIEHSSNALLQSIEVDNQPLPGFSPHVLAYYYQLPCGTTQMPIVTYQMGDMWQVVTPHDGGINGDYTLHVQAEDGITQQTYVIHFSVALSNNALLSNLLVGEEAIPNFDPEQLTYTYLLPYGQTTIPAVRGVKTMEQQNVEVVNATTLQEVSAVTVTAQDGVTQNVYTIAWGNEKSNNANLNMIYIDGTPLPNFDPLDTDYVVSLPYGTTQMPTVTWQAGNAHQTIQDQISDNMVWITVEAQNGNMNEYIVSFVVEKSDENRLKNIYIDGVALPDFNPDQVEYMVVYPIGTPVEEVPTIEQVTFQKFDQNQQVSLMQDNMVLMLRVMAQNGNVRTYVIVQSIALSNNTQLESIAIDGVELPNFDPEVLQYTYTLPFGSTAVPRNITWVKAEDEQTVKMSINQLGRPTEIFVTAQDGTKAVYSIQFVVDTYDPSSVPTDQNVCISRTVDGHWKFTTNTANVTLILTTLDGKTTTKVQLPLVDVNVPDICSPEAEGYIYQTRQTEVVSYYFLHNMKTVVKSGKFRVSK